jgi:hypothetical protein
MGPYVGHKEARWRPYGGDSTLPKWILFISFFQKCGFIRPILTAYTINRLAITFDGEHMI